ncbi:MAG: helix-turn-helix domain-containing protein [Paludibacteraceae bacterium]|nr:helix-turn-helix domain-containing protein [Paludibacteraceae bacterium]
MKTKRKNEAELSERLRICDILRTRRKLMRVNQTYVAKRLGISLTAYAKIERGESSVSFDRLVSICQILHLNIQALGIKNKESFFYNEALECLYREIKSLKEETKKFRNYLASESCTIFTKEKDN